MRVMRLGRFIVYLNYYVVNVWIKTVFKEVYEFFAYGTDSVAGKETLMYPTCGGTITRR